MPKEIAGLTSIGIEPYPYRLRDQFVNRKLWPFVTHSWFREPNFIVGRWTTYYTHAVPLVIDGQSKPTC